ncbi:hypothetical protein ACE1B6_13790 [Aerosakkonemataceae cyanobacterium BLCC-F154]|uniref:Uncharacterized protein n=1 Tax=Floridaenema fluviatile BLCC-F154 TaxID=3153640 RepID=A0ABV4YBW9_9CYAN
MSFSVFNESFYLAHNPDVQAAVNAGNFASGLEHFQKFGLAEGRVNVSPFYDEQYYLRKNPDVGTAVTSGFLRSGLEHFILAGETEGRRASLLFDEQFYSRKNPDVAAAVTSGNLSSGLTHYLQFGQSENRSGTSFNEFAYSGITKLSPETLNLEKVNPDVEAAVQAGLFASTLEHYIKFGQFEDRGGGTFNGTTGNDTVVAFGQIDTLYGVDANIGPELRGATPTGGQALHLGFGVNEADVLFGGNGQDTFVLGQTITTGSFPSESYSIAVPFYQGNGDADYAWIRNYEIGKDEIVLAGAVWNYDFVQSGDNLNIYLSGVNVGNNSSLVRLENPDLVARVEGVISLNEIQYKLQFTGGQMV